MKKTKITVYQSKKNPCKFVEVHTDGYGHYSFKRFTRWWNGVTCIHDNSLSRLYKSDIQALLKDYVLV